MGVTAALAAAVTLAVVLVEPLQFAYRSPRAHVAMETAAALIGATAAALSYVRLRRRRTLADLLLCGALVVLATTNAGFSLVPTLLEANRGSFATWAPVAGRFVGALGFLAAGLAGDRRIGPRSNAVRNTTLAAVATCALIAAIVAALGDVLPRGVDVAAPAEASSRPSLSAGPAILTMHLLSAAAYTGAALGFLRQALRTGERTRTWLAVAMTVAAGSRVNFFLYPSLYSEYVYVGDALRLCFYLVLLAGTLAEILAYERRLADMALFEERRRLARDLHDGLAQELAYISGQVQRLGGQQERIKDEIARAAERAVRESRLAISALTRPLGSSLTESLEAAVNDAVRGAAFVEVDGDHSRELAAEAREALIRIAAEAASNAVRHGGARRVRLELEDTDRLVLRVIDDGRGFDAGAPPTPGSFGLTSMRERAEALGGRLSIRSRPGAGAVVEVELP